MERKAVAAGCTVDELIARDERRKRMAELHDNRRSGWPTIARHAMDHGRALIILW